VWRGKKTREKKGKKREKREKKIIRE